MNEPFALVRTLEDLDSLDEQDMIDGYRDGLAGEPEPGPNRGRAFWHGWRSGMMDRGLLPLDEAAQTLARLWLARERERRVLAGKEPAHVT